MPTVPEQSKPPTSTFHKTKTKNFDSKDKLKQLEPVISEEDQVSLNFSLATGEQLNDPYKSSSRKLIAKADLLAAENDNAETAQDELPANCYPDEVEEPMEAPEFKLD